MWCVVQMEILRFISAVFYGGPDKLTAGGCIPSVLELTPLQFYAVQGQEVQDAHSTSFYNRAESSEVVERVVSLLDNWPQEWGRVAPEEIGVVTPYHEQVSGWMSVFKGSACLNAVVISYTNDHEYGVLFVNEGYFFVHRLLNKVE